MSARLKRNSKTFCKWSVPFLILFSTFSYPDQLHFWGKESQDNKSVNAGFFSDAVFRLSRKNTMVKNPEIQGIQPVSEMSLKDPFKPLKFDSGLKRKIPRNPLQGIEVQKDRLFAVIGGRRVKVGDRIYNMRVINISKNKVVLAGHGRACVYYLF